MNLQVCCEILVTKTDIASGSLDFAGKTLRRIGGSQLGPWPGNRGGAAFAGLIPVRVRLAVGEGGVERLEEVALYLGRASDGVGVVGEGSAVSSGGGAPVAWGGGGGVGELQGEVGEQLEKL